LLSGFLFALLLILKFRDPFWIHEVRSIAVLYLLITRFAEAQAAAFALVLPSLSRAGPDT
jgi:hypothetical protein